MSQKAKLGICLLAGLLLAVAAPSMAMANHEDYPAEGFGGVQPHVAQAGHEIQDIFGVPYVGGYRAGDPQDHGKGLALDFMVYEDAALGDGISNHILANWEHYNVSYIIWKQRINFGSGWQPMEDRGSITQNHFDHVHVSFNPQSSAAVDTPAEEAPEREDPSVGGPSVVDENPVTQDDMADEPQESPELSPSASAPVEEEPMAEEPAPAPQSAAKDPAVEATSPVQEPAAFAPAQPTGISEPGSAGEPGVGEPGGTGRSGAGEPGSVEQSGGSIQSMDYMNENMSLPGF